MILYQKKLQSKELESYKTFLNRLKTIGNNFLVKGNMWIPSIRNDLNTPGIHIAKDPILTEYYDINENPEYLKFTCSHLSETMKSISEVKGRKTLIQITVCDDGIILEINNDQWIIASKYNESTTDFIPNHTFFQSILTRSDEWYDLSKDLLQSLTNGHPISIKGKITGTNETTIIRLTRKLMKLQSVQSRKIDYTGQYTLCITSNTMFDDTICDLILHMNYPNMECINIYHARKYTV